jgi:hypothetical protein
MTPRQHLIIECTVDEHGGVSREGSQALQTLRATAIEQL